MADDPATLLRREALLRHLVGVLGDGGFVSLLPVGTIDLLAEDANVVDVERVRGIEGDAVEGDLDIQLVTRSKGLPPCWEAEDDLRRLGKQGDSLVQRTIPRLSEGVRLQRLRLPGLRLRFRL